MSTFDMESAALGSIAAVPALTDPLAAVIGVGGIAMGVVLFIASRSFAPTSRDHASGDHVSGDHASGDRRSVDREKEAA